MKKLKLSNHIFDYKLNNAEFEVLVYLCGLKGYYNLLGYCVKVKQSTIAKRCCLSEPTVQRALKSLMIKDIIISKIRTIKLNGYLGTTTYVLRPYDISKGFFFSDRKSVSHLHGRNLKVYLFTAKSIDVRTGYGYNSYTDIAKALKMNRSDVIKAVNDLVMQGHISKELKLTGDGDYTDNHYKVIFSIHHKRISKKAQKKMSYSFTSKLITGSIILLNTKFHKYNTIFIKFCQVLNRNSCKKALQRYMYLFRGGGGQTDRSIS